MTQQRKEAEKAAERQQQTSIAAMEIKSRRELAQFEADMRLQTAKLSQAWELEKMQRESELDFQNDQKKLQFNRDAVTQKQMMAKEKYAAYSEHIDSDKTLAPNEKEQFKRLAYDKMIADIDIADQIYFPEKYAEAKGGGLGDLLGAQGTTQTAPAAAPSDAESKPAVELTAAMVQVNKPNMSLDDVIAEAKSVAKPTLIQNIAARLSEQAKGQVSEEEIMTAAKQQAEIELKVQEGFIKSKRMGNLPTAWESETAPALSQYYEKGISGVSQLWKNRGRIPAAWNKFIAEQRAESRNYPHPAAVEQARADKAREAVKPLYKRRISQTTEGDTTILMR